MPAHVCGVDEEVQLHDGNARVRSARWPEYSVVGVSAGPWEGDGLEFGDLTGDGTDEAAVTAWCTNTGGTAGGQLAHEYIIFTSDNGSIRPLGFVTPRPSTKYHVSYIGSISIEIGRVSATELFYGPADATCCPSGRRRTTWIFERGELIRGRSHVSRTPTP